MLSISVLFSVVAVSSAIVCTPELCAGIRENQKPLSCKGSIIPNGGFCGCTDACAKVENETCQHTFMFGIIPQGTCDDGLVCQARENMAFGLGICAAAATNSTNSASRRVLTGNFHTACETMRIHRMTSMVIWQGWWLPKCDALGRFEPEQCDNTQQCFCVDTMTGVVDDTTKMLGHVDCTSQAKVATETPKVGNSKRDMTGSHHTTCTTLRMQRMISMVVWQGWWLPKCDVLGHFEPEQCDNTHQCFCVDTMTGVVDETTKMLGHVDCTSQAKIATETPKVAAKRQTTHNQTKCEQIRAIRMISFVTWKGMWTPECDSEGHFMPEQCDNTGHCFCVEAITGTVDESTKVLGHALCLAKAPTATDVLVSNNVAKRQTTHNQTKCEQIRAVRMISFVIWKGMWTPECDVLGNFMPEQCDNTGHCFCVEAVTGTVDENTKVLGHASCLETAKIATEAHISNTVREVKQHISKCRQILSARMTSPSTYEGEWFPQCDMEGNFAPEQCDLNHNCFCVDTVTGVVDETTKQVGAVDCSAHKTVREADQHISKCRQLLSARLTSQVMYEGLWFPQCDKEDNFMPEQCDINHNCFCVDTVTGVVDETTKQFGAVDCSAHKTVREVDDRALVEETTTPAYTKCQQMRAVRSISLVIWEGWWLPKCDVMGRFLPEQCDNTKHCFCVSADDGTVDDSSKVLGSADCDLKNVI